MSAPLDGAQDRNLTTFMPVCAIGQSAPGKPVMMAGQTVDSPG